MQWAFITVLKLQKNIGSLRKVQNVKIGNIAGYVGLRLSMDGSSKCNLPLSMDGSGKCRSRSITLSHFIWRFDLLVANPLEQLFFSLEQTLLFSLLLFNLYYIHRITDFQEVSLCLFIFCRKNPELYWIRRCPMKQLQ